MQTLSPNRTWLWVGAGVVGVALIGALLIFNLQGEAGIAGVLNFGRQARGHVDTPLETGDLPPVGGEHNPVWQNCGIYTEPIGSGNAVHSMEHGALWITYRPDLPAEEIAALQDLVRGQTYLLLSPYPGLRSPVVATAWSVQLELDSAFDDRLEDFIDRYRLGPTTPERGAACTDGIGEPIP